MRKEFWRGVRRRVVAAAASAALVPCMAAVAGNDGGFGDAICGANDVAAPIVYSDSTLTATVIEPGVTVIETIDKTTMYLVEGDSAALLIDTGTKCATLGTAVAQLTSKPLTVVLTHGHYDHADNVGFFPEIYMHLADTVLHTPALVNYAGRIHPVADGDTFRLGGRELMALHTPGHTPGSICLVDKSAGIAFTGDAFGSGALWLQLEPQPRFDHFAESCGRMIELMDTEGVERLYVGHYPYLKRPLGLQYMLDVAVNARKIDCGDTAESTLFWDNKARTMTYGESEIVFRAENSGRHDIQAPVVVLKLDDMHYGEGTDTVSPRWPPVLDYLRQRGIKANVGIIGYSLTPERPDYLQWLRRQAASGHIEFWNHGYNNRTSPEGKGEFEQDYASQCRALQLTDSLARSLAGLELCAWGRHWTECNEFTDSALATVGGIRLIFGEPSAPRHFKGVVMPENLRMEYAPLTPSYKDFLVNYLGKWRGLRSFYLQGHPDAWDERCRAEVRSVLERLIADGARFVTVSDYMKNEVEVSGEHQ